MGAKKRELKYSTKLDKEQFVRIWNVAEAFVATNGSIRNQQLRQVADIGYDQAIHFFNWAVSEERLVRVGSGGGTHYMLKDK
jgi:hypothetical protein